MDVEVEAARIAVDLGHKPGINRDGPGRAVSRIGVGEGDDHGSRRSGRSAVDVRRGRRCDVLLERREVHGRIGAREHRHAEAIRVARARELVGAGRDGEGAGRKLGADRAVPEVARVDVDVETGRVISDLVDQRGARRRGAGREVVRIVGRQRDDHRSGDSGRPPVDVRRRRRIQVLDHDRE
jgi:hypothetical protein